MTASNNDQSNPLKQTGKEEAVASRDFQPGEDSVLGDVKSPILKLASPMKPSSQPLSVTATVVLTKSTTAAASGSALSMYRSSSIPATKVHVGTPTSDAETARPVSRARSFDASSHISQTGSLTGMRSMLRSARPATQDGNNQGHLRFAGTAILERPESAVNQTNKIPDYSRGGTVRPITAGIRPSSEAGPRAGWSSSSGSNALSFRTLSLTSRRFSDGFNPSTPRKAVDLGHIPVPPAASSPKVPSPKAISLMGDQIKARLEAQRQALDRSSNLLAMFLNRCNSSWASTQQWGPPSVKPLAEEQAWSVGENAAIGRADLIRKVRNGMVSTSVCK